MALLAALAAAASAQVSMAAPYLPCPTVHPKLTIHAAGTDWTVTRLTALRLSCSQASAAVRTGVIELTPGGPIFHTRGFRCNSPIGPPQSRATHRYFSCSRAQQRLKFWVAGIP